MLRTVVLRSGGGSVVIDPAARGVWQELDAELRPFVARRVRAHVDVDDIIQEVFLRMQRGLPGLQRPGRHDRLEPR